MLPSTRTQGSFVNEHTPPVATISPDTSPWVETQLSEALAAILRETPSFHVVATYGEVATTACSALLRLFPARSCSILRHRKGRFELAASQPVGLAQTFPKAGLEQNRDVLRLLARRSPFFLDRPAKGLSTDQNQTLGRRPALWMALGPEEVANLLIVLEWQPQEPPPDDRTLLVAQLFGDQIALALAQAARREYHDEAALLHARLEASLLPRLLPTHPLIDVVVRSRPCERRLQIGGDFYDVLTLADGRLAAIVGDVSGHGPDSAALGATLRTTWRALNLAGVGETALMGLLEEVLVQERASPDLFATAFALWLDRDGVTMRMINAGHPPPILLGERPRVLTVSPIGPLGLGLPLVWQPSLHVLPRPWSMLLHTDGLVEGRRDPGSRDRLGIEGLLTQLRAASHDRGERLLDDLLQAAESANGGPLADDVALLLLSRGAGSGLGSGITANTPAPQEARLSASRLAPPLLPAPERA